MRVRISVTGTGIASSAVAAKTVAFKKAATEGLGEAAVEVLQGGQSMVPVRSGRMKAGMRYNVNGNNAEIYSTAPYAAEVEDAPPYMRQSQNNSWPLGGAVRRTLEQQHDTVLQLARKKI